MYMNLKPSKHKKIISFNTTNMTSFGFIIVGTLPKIESLGGGGAHNFLLERGINL